MQELRCGDRENYHRHRGERQTSQGRYYRRPPTTRKLYFFCRRTAGAIIGWKGQAFEATQSLRRMVMPDYFCPRSVLCESSMLIRIKKSGGLGSNNFLFGDLNLKQRNRKRMCNTEFNLIFNFCFPSYLFCCF
ncbi:uncharacterized protein LOC115983224 isoform X1 [Quercus lobata]|uniref:uncharacterized protein LOC115983224 isoform X1 n=1 Tax=Quercus lobata TaxID=97700 RepID=UPI0012484EF2|nr:uncharacterized protein LOC115983224 isoform X1 [Quercus lobata]